MRIIKANLALFGSICIIMLLFTSSCASRKKQTVWMDVQDAKNLDRKKGNRSKHAMKSHYKHQKSHNY
ncbi:MAG: hypothetical protein OCD76_12595 [Reichenbachiella sp.]